MRTTRAIFYWIDILVQFLLIAGISLTLAYCLFIEKENFLLAFVFLFFLGIWQLGSAFLKMCSTREKLFGVYFCTALFYCLILYSGAQWNPLPQLPEWLEMFVIAMGIGIIPFIASLIYLYLCLTFTRNRTN